MSEEQQAPFHGFAPVYGPNSRALILGTWPSPQSRLQGFYYGHKQNRFWPLIASLTGQAVPESIEEKKNLILSGGLALWDTLADCEIIGARDDSIRNPKPNDIAGLLAKTKIEKIFCNGAAAYKFYTKYAQPLVGLAAVKLPSTSPANAAFRMERLRQEWGEALGPWLIK